MYDSFTPFMIFQFMVLRSQNLTTQGLQLLNARCCFKYQKLQSFVPQRKRGTKPYI